MKRVELHSLGSIFTSVGDALKLPVLRSIKAGLYRIWCGVNRLGDSGVNTIGDTSAFVNPTAQLLLTWRGKIRMDGVGIVFEENTSRKNFA